MNDKLKNIIPKVVSGNATPEETELFNSEFRSSPELFEEYKNIASIWDRTEKEEIKDYPDIDDQWYILAERITRSSKAGEQGKVFAKFKMPIWQILFQPKLKPVYSGIIVVLLMAAVLFFFNTDNTIQKNLITYSTNNAENLDVRLPDGSFVKLNSGSKIEFDENRFSKLREINLDGEAFFVVTKNGAPFVVTTPNAFTKVLGTEFNVWSRKNETRVIVKEGTVSLSSSSPKKESVTLTKDESSAVVKSNAPKQIESVNSRLMLGWLEGKLVFNKTRLPEVIEETQRYYNVSINIQNPKLESFTLTGSFSTEDVDSVLSMISLALDCNYEKEDEGYVLK